LRFGEENDYPRMFCSFGNNSDFNNTSHRRIKMETIEIVFVIATIIGGLYIVWDALYV
jgi:hypothetical protein